MKTTLKVLLLILSISLISCEKKYKVKTPPEISTLKVTEITATTAVCGGQIDKYWDDLGMGVCWDTEPDPIPGVTYFIEAALPGKSFSCEMTNLKPNTKYYARAFIASRGNSTINYGAQMVFTTLAE